MLPAVLLPLKRLAELFLVLLALVLPFEAPLMHVGPLQLTTVELVLYATLGTWVLTLLDRRQGRTATPSDPLLLPAVLWIVVNCIAAALAPVDRIAAIKFALRTTSGVLVFFAARDLARPPKVTQRVLFALTAGALLSATTAAFDWLLSSTRGAWQWFNAGTFESVGLTRARGVFAYPTIGAMYWEAATPLIVVAPTLLLRSHRWRSAGVAMTAVAAVFLAIAIHASATRSALVGALVACMFLFALGLRFEWMRWSTAAVIGVLLLSSALVVLAPNSHRGLRLLWWQDDQWLRADYSILSGPTHVSVGETFTTSVAVRNSGAVTWQHSGTAPVFLSYHWEPVGRSTATRENFEGLRTSLSTDVAPGQTLTVLAIVRAPEIEGAYRLRWDLVSEHIAWFSEKGNTTADQNVEVERPEKDKDRPRPLSHPAVIFAPPPPSRGALWRAAIALWREHPAIGLGPDNFRRHYQRILVPAPGGIPYTDTRIHANSLYFETLANLGLVGFVVLGWIAFALARVILQRRTEGAFVPLACGAACGAFFVHGALDYFFEFTPLLGVFWLLLGLTVLGDKSSAQ